MIVFGIDPGSRWTGYGVLRLQGGRVTPVAYGRIAGGPGAVPARLAVIGGALDALLGEHRPDCVGVEQAFVARSARSALVLGQVRGVALWLAARRGLPVHEFAPRAVKLSVTGRGGASKPQVADMVRRLLGLARAPQADAADALAVALCTARRLGLETRLAQSAASARAPRTARTATTADGRTVDLARAFAPVRRGREQEALRALAAARGVRKPR